MAALTLFVCYAPRIIFFFFFLTEGKVTKMTTDR
jgi:hypothetical protein